MDSFIISFPWGRAAISSSITTLRESRDDPSANPWPRTRSVMKTMANMIGEFRFMVFYEMQIQCRKTTKKEIITKQYQPVRTFSRGKL